MKFQTKSLAMLLTVATSSSAWAPQKPTWKTTSLLSGKISIEAPGEIKPSKFPPPKSDHPIFKSGQSFYTVFGPVELAILVGELRGPGGPSTIELGRQYLKYSAEIKKLKIQTVTPYTSKASKDSIQLLGRCQRDPSVTWGMVVHSARKGNRQILVRLFWPGKDKKSLDVAFRISNSLRMN